MNIDLKNLRCVYFIGIGGIGMSALARYFNSKGITVCGYDKTPTLLTSQLISEGIPIHFKEDISLIPTEVDLVVYTPAIPEDHEELSFLKRTAVPVVKRSVVLGWVTQNTFTIAISGTHGKTTISSMIAHIFKHADMSINAFIGGISLNYHSNVIFTENCDITIVEADEYDRSFHCLNPDIAVVSSLDADHLDVYETHEKLKESYNIFVAKLKEKGKLIAKKDLPLNIRKDNTMYTYDINNTNADYHALNITLENNVYNFDVKTVNGILKNVKIGTPVYHNIENAIAAIAVCQIYGIEDKIIKEALLTFKGVKRRFEIILETENLVYIDDYAHHPDEISACIDSARKLYPNKKILGIFQPHLYTRTRDLAEKFATSLEKLDELILLDIYPAREQPIEGIDANFLFNKIKLKNKRICTKEEILHCIPSQSQVIITMGAGDIDQLVIPIADTLKRKLREMI